MRRLLGIVALAVGCATESPPGCEGWLQLSADQRVLVIEEAIRITSTEMNVEPQIVECAMRLSKVVAEELAQKCIELNDFDAAFKIVSEHMDEQCNDLRESI